MKKVDLFSLEHGVIFEFYTKLLRFPSTQGSEIEGFAFKQIQDFKAPETPAPITTLILSLFWVCDVRQKLVLGRYISLLDTVLFFMAR